MYLGDRANEQANVILKSAEATMKRMMDLAIENDCATLMYESQRIAGDIAILRTALLGRDDLVSITDTFDCFGDPTDKSVEELEDEERERELFEMGASEDDEECGCDAACPFCEDDSCDYDIKEVLSMIGSSLGEILDILKKSNSPIKEDNKKPKSNAKSSKIKEDDK